MALPIPIKRGKKSKAVTQNTPAATGQVQSLTRGLKLLEYISESDGNVALTDLAQQAGLPNSTTHRLLTTMQQQGFVRQVGDLGLWTMGAHAFIVGSSFLQSRNLLAMVHPMLRRLMDESGETVNLAVLDHSDYQAIIIDQVQCTALMRMSAPIGGKLPMHASGAGKAFLSTLPDDQLVQLLHKKGLHAYTQHTLTNPTSLKENLALIRKQGYSFDDEEHALGLRCIAACLFDEHHEAFASISISGPISRITDDRVTELGALVIHAAKEITQSYGGGTGVK
ncbi:glyoxylate bypass operon transcriptional repressor IclR [Yersinia wautersii]|uniref:glyoxylate bypass operon transcriptional repressor IclR n=1 Tax=Yersinia wautersii TaxID=1341643 RepID=UPI00041D2961|nr:glyoxylate bypass operon transcriptional repressor IclR [Yersinia wautersii]